MSALVPKGDIRDPAGRAGGSQAITATRQRDLRSAVKRVAGLLGNEPAAITLDMDAISGGLRAISPLAVGMTAKRFANIRSDFVAAVRASGMVPATAKAKKVLSPAWCELSSACRGGEPISVCRDLRVTQAQTGSNPAPSTMKSLSPSSLRFAGNHCTGIPTCCTGR
jgi:hypothetical protein